MKWYVGKAFIVVLIFVAVMAMPSVYAQPEEEGQPSPPAAEATKPPENAAVVNGANISYDAFAVELEMHRRRFQQQGQPIPDAMMPRLRAQVLENLINEKLLFQAAEKKDIQVAKEDIDKEMGDIRKRFKTQEEYQTTLSNMRMTEEELRQQLVQRAMIRKLVEDEVSGKVKVTDKASQDFYKDNPQYFQRPEEIKARHILIKVAKDASDADKAEARKHIDGLKERIKKGEDFGELARTESQGPSSTKGGDLGFFSKGRMVKPFEDAAFALGMNEVSDVVETQFGYHLIQKLDHKDAQTVPYDEAKERIVTNLRNEQIQKGIQAYLKTLHQDAKIERFVE